MNNISRDCVFKNESFQAHFTDTVLPEVRRALNHHPSRDNLNALFSEKIAPLVKSFELDIHDIQVLGDFKGRTLACAKALPVGIRNQSGKDCWLNAIVQLLTNTKSVNTQGFFSDYKKAQEQGQTATLSNADTLRLCTGENLGTMEDATENLGKFLTLFGFSYQTKDPTTPVITLPLPTSRNLQTRFNKSEVHFTQAPEDLFLEASRLKMVNGRIRKNTDSLYIPKQLSLPGECKDKYELVGSILHSGTGDNQHYVAVKKVAGQWYLINDSTVTKLKEGQALAKTAKGSVFHFQKIDPSLVAQEKTEKISLGIFDLLSTIFQSFIALFI